MRTVLMSVAASLMAACVYVLFFMAPEEATQPIEVAVDEGSVYERAYSPSIGPTDATVTIVEFFDPACGACGAFYPFVKQILAKHSNVRLVLRYATFHRGTPEVVRMLEAARLQGVYLPVLEALMARQLEWTINHKAEFALAEAIAVSAGYDKEAGAAQMVTPEMDKLLAQEKADIRTLAVDKTPTFFVNEKPLPEFSGKHLYELVVSELGEPRPVSI